MVKIFKHNGQAFSAISEAEKWCKENGYSVGTMCAEYPMGIKKGNYHIEKWRNLSSEDIDKLDGHISGEFRSGDVTITLKD
jgi:hypothetical protein